MQASKQGCLVTLQVLMVTHAKPWLQQATTSQQPLVYLLNVITPLLTSPLTPCPPAALLTWVCQ
jgi:hypothetical protein